MRRTAVLSLSRVAVVTASSVSGRACVQRLLQQETSVRACCRSEEKLQETLASLPAVSGGQDRVVGLAGVNAEDASSLSLAFEGTDAAVVVTPLDYSRGFAQDAELSINMIRAAIKENVKRVIHVGSWTTAYPEILPGLSSRFVATEEFLQASPEVPSDLEWTVLRGGYFLNNITHLFGEDLRKGGTSLAFPSVTMPPVDVRDIGEVAAELCLLPSGSDGFAPFQHRFLQCSGPSMLKFTTITQLLGESLAPSLGKQLKHDPMDVEAWCEGKPPPLQELLRHMAAQQEAAVPFDPQDVADMERLLGRRLRGVTDWAKDHEALLTPPASDQLKQQIRSAVEGN